MRGERLSSTANPRGAEPRRETRAALKLDEQQRDLLNRKLEELRTEHRDLDDVIARLTEKAPFDQLQLQRLKKRKLVLKDLMLQLESRLIPDIIA